MRMFGRGRPRDAGNDEKLIAETRRLGRQLTAMAQRLDVFSELLQDEADRRRPEGEPPVENP